MANLHRGEIDAALDGKTFRMCLTLNALAELEAAFGEEDMLALATRFEAGRLSARDCVRVIGAGLRGSAVYGNYAPRHPDPLRTVPVAAPHPVPRPNRRSPVSCAGRKPHVQACGVLPARL